MTSPEHERAFALYHPVHTFQHDASCASLCTNFDEETDTENGGCHMLHSCSSCPDGGLSYEAFVARWPDSWVAE